MSWASIMAGFEVTLHGRFWVTPDFPMWPKFRRLLFFAITAVYVAIACVILEVLHNPEWHQHLLKFSRRVWVLFVTQDVGSTGRGFVSSIAVSLFCIVAVAVFIGYLQGWKAMSDHIAETAAMAVVGLVTVLLLVYGTQFAWEVAKYGYADHQYFVDKVKSIRDKAEQNLSGASGELESQIDSLKHKNSSLQSELDKRKNVLNYRDTAFYNTHGLLHAAQEYRDGRHGQRCVTYITAPPSRFGFALTIQQVIGNGNCAPFGPLPFDLHSGSDAEQLAMRDAQPDFIMCHVNKGDSVGEKFCSDLGNLLLVKVSYVPLPNPEKLYKPSHSSDKVIWLQFGTDAQWKSEYYAKQKR